MSKSFHKGIVRILLVTLAIPYFIYLVDALPNQADNAIFLRSIFGKSIQCPGSDQLYNITLNKNGTISYRCSSQGQSAPGGDGAYDYNHTEIANTFTTSRGYITDGNTNWDNTYGFITNTYNSTYNKWAYNQSDGSYNATYNIWAYNQTGVSAGSFNTTYDKYAYNQSDGSYNVTYNSFAYNQSDGSFNITYNGFAYNQSDGSYNSTYDAGRSFWYNFSVNTMLNSLLDPNADKTFGMDSHSLSFLFTNPSNQPTYDGAFEIQTNGAFSGDLLHVHQHTGNPGVSDLVHIEAEDSDVLPLHIIGAGTYVGNISGGKLLLNNNIVDDWLYNMTIGDGSYNITYQNWNKTYADTLYCSITFNYNQSLALYNQFNSQWNSTYNVTYSTWSYNQSDGSYNSTYAGYGTNSYNHTAVILGYNSQYNSTYNSTYALYAYNHSLTASTFNSTYDDYSYNHSLTASTFNSTYAGYAPNVYNHSSIILAQYTSQFNSTYNSTYAATLPFAYNHSTINNNFTVNQTMAAGITVAGDQNKSTFISFNGTCTIIGGSSGAMLAVC